MRRAVAILAPMVLVGLLVACSGGGIATPDTTLMVGSPSDYSRPGPFRVATTTLSEAGKPVLVYYPASGSEGTTEAPVASGGPFPVVVFSHGYGSLPQFSASHLAHLASWGSVVAAPDHTDRDLSAAANGVACQPGADLEDLHATIGVLGDENRPGGRFAGAIDLDHIAAVGHSSGGGAAARLAYDPAISTFIGLAPASPLDPDPAGSVDVATLAGAYGSANPPDKPSLILAGDDDDVVPPAAVEDEFRWLAAPKRLAILAGANHLSFIDLCPSGPADDGSCADPAQAERVRVIDHLTVAQLRHVFGLDPTDASLDPAYVENEFPGALASYDSIG